MVLALNDLDLPETDGEHDDEAGEHDTQPREAPPKTDPVHSAPRVSSYAIPPSSASVTTMSSPRISNRKYRAPRGAGPEMTLPGSPG